MHPRGRRGCQRACTGLPPASEPRRDRKLRGLTSRRHLTTMPCLIVPRWIASGFLPRSQGRRGGLFRRGTERVRTLSPNEAANEKDLVALDGTTYQSGCARWGTAAGCGRGTAGVVCRFRPSPRTARRAPGTSRTTPTNRSSSPACPSGPAKTPSTPPAVPTSTTPRPGSDPRRTHGRDH